MPYSKEYINWINSSEWKAKSKKCQGLTRKHCILFPWLKSRHCHHLTYRNMKQEIPVRDTVALSVTAHKIIHWRIFWKVKKVRPYVNYFLRFLMVISIVFWNVLGVFIK
mgnify:FL=1